MRLQKTHKLEDAHEDAIWAAAWVPGGATLITGSVDENVKAWDASAENIQEPLHTFTGECRCILPVLDVPFLMTLILLKRLWDDSQTPRPQYPSGRGLSSMRVNFLMWN